MSKIKNVTEPSDGIFQVRVRRNNEFFSKCFSVKTYGTRNKTLRNAIEWRDSIVAKKGSIDRVGQKTKHNGSTGIHGISSRIKTVRGQNSYLIFIAHFKNQSGEHKNRQFSAGNIESLSEYNELKALKVCLLFRKQYEQSRALDTPFSEREFENWKSWQESEITLRLSSTGVGRAMLNEFIQLYKFK